MKKQNTVTESSPLFIVRLNIVDCLTLSGVFFSCLSAMFVFSGDYAYALGVLYIAVIADAFDGVLARKFNLTRNFGRYLDGFVDTLDYLILPALFLYLWGFDAWYESLLLVLFIMSGFIRLSVFNEIGNVSDENTSLGYLGAPVFWSALLLGPLYLLAYVIGKDYIFTLLLILLPTFSFTMLHKATYYKFKNPLFMLICLLILSLLFFIIGFSSKGDTTLLTNTLSAQLILALSIILPVSLAGTLHMIAVKKNILPILNKPINRTIFGENKTWRGALLMPLFTVVGFYIIEIIAVTREGNSISLFNEYPTMLLGAVIGLAYIIAELPNSAFKRYLGIAPGKLPNKQRYLFILMDQLDSIVGCCLAYYLFFNISFVTLLYAVFIAILLALLIKQILYRLGYKDSAS